MADTSEVFSLDSDSDPSEEVETDDISDPSTEELEEEDTELAELQDRAERAERDLFGNVGLGVGEPRKGVRELTRAVVDFFSLQERKLEHLYRTGSVSVNPPQELEILSAWASAIDTRTRKEKDNTLVVRKRAPLSNRKLDQLAEWDKDHMMFGVKGRKAALKRDTEYEPPAFQAQPSVADLMQLEKKTKVVGVKKTKKKTIYEAGDSGGDSVRRLTRVQSLEGGDPVGSVPIEESSDGLFFGVTTSSSTANRPKTWAGSELSALLDDRDMDLWTTRWDGDVLVKEVMTEYLMLIHYYVLEMQRRNRVDDQGRVVINKYVLRLLMSTIDHTKIKAITKDGVDRATAMVKKLKILGKLLREAREMYTFLGELIGFRRIVNIEWIRGDWAGMGARKCDAVRCSFTDSQCNLLTLRVCFDDGREDVRCVSEDIAKVLDAYFFWKMVPTVIRETVRVAIEEGMFTPGACLEGYRDVMGKTFPRRNDDQPLWTHIDRQRKTLSKNVTNMCRKHIRDINNYLLDKLNAAHKMEENDVVIGGILADIEARKQQWDAEKRERDEGRRKRREERDRRKALAAARKKNGRKHSPVSPPPTM